MKEGRFWKSTHEARVKERSFLGGLKMLMVRSKSGINSPVEVGSLSYYYLQGFLYIQTVVVYDLESWKLFKCLESLGMEMSEIAPRPKPKRKR